MSLFRGERSQETTTMTIVRIEFGLSGRARLFALQGPVRSELMSSPTSRRQPTARRFPWQRSFRKLPRPYLFKLQRMSTAACVVAGVRTIARADLERGLFSPRHALDCRRRRHPRSSDAKTNDRHHTSP